MARPPCGTGWRSVSEAAPLRISRFVSFDGAMAISTMHQRPDRYRQLEADLGPAKRIPRGAGLSYSAASFGTGVVVQEMTAFDRFLAFDEACRTVTVEAGLTVGRLLEWAVSKGLYFPVLPGYPSITVGGCIAADVHGKNPARDGTFADWVQSLTLFHPAHGSRRIESGTHAEQFAATCGGFGLTGTIVCATLRLACLPAPAVDVRIVPALSLAHALDVLRADPEVDFGYSWHDGAGRGSAFGRGLVFFGRWAEARCGRSRDSYRPMTARGRAGWPVSLWNRWTARAANACFRRLSGAGRARHQSVFEAAFPFAKRTIYHRLYGRTGLAEVQVLVPDAGTDDFVRELARLVERLDPPAIMMSMKRFRGRQTSLSMSGTGTLVALDLARAHGTERFLSEFDALVVDSGAQPNLTKDSRLPASVAARALPHYGRFRGSLLRIDPERLYESELSTRLQL